MGTTYEHESVYWGKVVEQKFGENRNGNPQLNITFKVLGKIDPSDPDGALLNCVSYERTAFMTITGNTIGFVTEHIQLLANAAGIAKPLTSWAQLNPEHPKFTHDFVNAELAFYCKHDTYEGKTNEKWSVARAGGGKRPEVDVLDDKKMRNLDALFGKHLKEVKPAPAKEQDAAPDDDPGFDDAPPANPPAVNQKREKANAAATAAQAPDDSIPF